jgi:hypothetical protein
LEWYLSLVFLTHRKRKVLLLAKIKENVEMEDEQVKELEVIARNHWNFLHISFEDI